MQDYLFQEKCVKIWKQNMTVNSIRFEWNLGILGKYIFLEDQKNLV